MSDIDWLKTSRDLLIGLAGKCMWRPFADWSRIGVVSVTSAWSLHALCARENAGELEMMESTLFWQLRANYMQKKCPTPQPVTLSLPKPLTVPVNYPSIPQWEQDSFTKAKIYSKSPKMGRCKAIKNKYNYIYNYKNMQFLTPALTVYHSTHRVMSMGPVLGWSMNVHTNTIVQFDTRQKQFICARHVPSSTLPVVAASSSDLCPRLLPQPPLASLFSTGPNPWP